MTYYCSCPNWPGWWWDSLRLYLRYLFSSREQTWDPKRFINGRGLTDDAQIPGTLSTIGESIWKYVYIIWWSFSLNSCHDFIKLYPFDLWTLLQESPFIKMFFWPIFSQWEQMKTPFLSFVVEKYLKLVAIIRLAYPDYCSWLVRQEF